MLGWIIVAVVVGWVGWFIVEVLKSDDRGLVIIPVIILGAFSTYPMSHYLLYRVDPIPKLEAYERTISQTKELIGERNINLQDMEITKTLAGVIKERNEYIAGLKAAKRNPFCLYKPILELE